MLVGIRDFPAQMGSATNSSDFTKEAKFGLDWLLKMWDSKSQTLYYQVGIGTDFDSSPDVLSDHDLWRLPQADDTLGGADPTLQYVRNRPVFVAGPAGSKISPNLAGRLAASFAGCFQIYAKTNPAFAQKCLLAAEQTFDLADTAPAGDLLTVAPFDFYGEDEWRDDMELGATELYFALAGADGPLPSTLHHTDPVFYLRAATHWAHAYITGPNDAADTLNLYDVSGLAHFELFRAIAAAGVRVLTNEKVDVDGLQILGVPYRNATQKGHLASELQKLGLDRDRASILLVHAPDHPEVAEAAGVSLQLSGHTHLGQFIPWSWFARKMYRQFVYGLSRSGKMQVFTSSGAGTWGPPLRLGSNPEIVMLQFE